jgi:mono/diheme cytochrome c family protein
MRVSRRIGGRPIGRARRIDGKRGKGTMPKLKLLACIAALGLGATGASAQSTAGMEEFLHSCASCHGLTGQGNGPVAEYMNVEVPDLTRLAMENDGEFPMLQVIRIIDGRTGVRGHGSDMPVWGTRYMEPYAPQISEYGAELAEMLVRGRILALAEHLQAIQE